MHNEKSWNNQKNSLFENSNAKSTMKKVKYYNYCNNHEKVNTSMATIKPMTNIKY